MLQLWHTALQECIRNPQSIFTATYLSHRDRAEVYKMLVVVHWHSSCVWISQYTYYCIYCISNTEDGRSYLYNTQKAKDVNQPIKCSFHTSQATTHKGGKIPRGELDDQSRVMFTSTTFQNFMCTVDKTERIRYVATPV